MFYISSNSGVREGLANCYFVAPECRVDEGEIGAMEEIRDDFRVDSSILDVKVSHKDGDVGEARNLARNDAI